MPTKAFEDGVKAGLKGEGENPYRTTVSDVISTIVTGGVSDIINKETGCHGAEGYRRERLERRPQGGEKKCEKGSKGTETDLGSALITSGWARPHTLVSNNG